jgi:polyisoprenyl-phosphate glycosyltransferase
MMYSIVLPVYNEEANIESLYTRVKKVLDELGREHEILFVNDGSSDRTFELLKHIHAKDKNVKIINFSRNFGHQTAVSAGLKYIKGDAVAVLDADLQDPPEVLPKFFAKLHEGYNTVYAIRTARKENIIKRFTYSAFYRLLSSISSINIPLDSGDFCVMDRKVVDAINSMPERNRFVRGLRSWVGYKQIGLEYERDAREAGASKYTMSKLFKLAFDGIFSFSYVPLQAITVLGSIAMVVSIVGSVWAIYERFFTPNYNSVPGFATTIILIMFIGGLQLFSLGVVGEYMRRMYDEIKARPQYIIDSTVGI